MIAINTKRRVFGRVRVKGLPRCLGQYTNRYCTRASAGKVIVAELAQYQLPSYFEIVKKSYSV